MSKNWDEEKNLWAERKSPLENQEQQDRDDYSRDRARIIHSASFRRLQGKTQVLGLGESDFYRTRLTHSIEVAQIASGVADFLRDKYKNDEDINKYIPTQNLIEAIALAHDIGHPPFGHGGEYALNYLMRDDGGFEGNAQNIRICTRLGEYSDANGLNLTRRTLLGLVKYPEIYSKIVNEDIYKLEKTPLNISSFKPPKFNFYDCDKFTFDWIMEPAGSLKADFSKVEILSNKHGKTQHKSFDTTIMELADDIAYGVHDLEDSIALKLVDQSDWDKEVVEKIKKLSNGLSKRIDEVTKQLFSRKIEIRKKAIGYLVGYFITNSEIYKKENFNHGLFKLKAQMTNDVDKELEILKEFIVKNVIHTPEVQTLQYKGQQMIIRLFEAIDANPSDLLPSKHYKKYEDNRNDKRIICDYIAGTTDEYVTRLYHKIFTPSTGSIFDRL
jgi:dGTPase